MRPRTLRALPVLLLALAAGACESSAGPERHSILGVWRSEGFPGAQVEMALTETARAVAGAGRWTTATGASAFGVDGTHTGLTVSLLLEFGDSVGVNLMAEFAEEDVLEGTLAGGDFSGEPIRFLRVDEDED